MKLTTDQFNRHVKIIRTKFWMNKHETFDLKDKNDFYCSQHVAERIVERGLEKDTDFIVGIVKWFIHNVFYKTTYCNRSYQVSIKNLKCCFLVKESHLTSKREVILTTVFESDKDYDVDEIIKLKF
ncbi:MAG TPA: hypothetical protein VFM18_23695 [Methanosarcina sp.]|nr:hypothetical protein [Methanosarcina sp.]